MQLSLLALPAAAFGAHYGGHRVDGPRYCAFARSFDSGRYYAARVVFDQNRASVQLDSGRTLVLTLDEENIEDPEEVMATAQDGSIWALAIDGLDEQSNGSRRLGSLRITAHPHHGETAEHRVEC